MQAANPAHKNEPERAERPDDALIALAGLLARQAAREAFNHEMKAEQAAAPQSIGPRPEQVANDNENERNRGDD